MVKRKGLIAALVLAAIAIGVAFLYVMVISPKFVEPAETYTQARNLYNKGSYMQAALKLESISSFSDSKRLAKEAWKLAGDNAYNEGNFDMASACYIKAGSNEEDVARMDECYLRLAENAFAKELISRGEIYLNCVSSSDANRPKVDEVRLAAAGRILDKGLTEANIDSAITRLEPCTGDAAGKIVQLFEERSKMALTDFNMEAALVLFSAAKRFCPEGELKALEGRMNESFTEAGKKALEQGMASFAQKCFDISGYVPKIENAEELYQQAVQLETENDVFGALTLFRRLGDYKDSRARADAIAEKVMRMPAAGAESAYAMLNADGTVTLEGEEWETGSPSWSGVSKISVNKTYGILGLGSNARVVSAGRNVDGNLDVSSWSGVADIACGDSHSLGLLQNGTVVAAGSGTYGKTDVGGWRNIVSIAVGGDASYGVMKNGMVVACGDNSDGRCDVSLWENIVRVSGGRQHAVGLRKDGTVVACGDNSYGQCDVENWSNVVFVSAGAYHTVALRSDGTLLACGRNDSGECAVGTFKSVAAVSAGSNYTLIVFEDGTHRLLG